MNQSNFNSFFVAKTSDAHIERGRQLMRRHPEVQELFGNYPISAVYIVMLAVTQVLIAWITSSLGFGWVFAAAFTAGACINLALFAMIHEVSHNLVFKRHGLNYLIGLVANFSLFVPLSVNYRYYHLAHHRFMGQARRDVDMPLQGEAEWVGNIWWRKLIWVVFFFWPYGVLRSMRNASIPKFDRMILLNWITQAAFLLFIYFLAGGYGVAYFALSMFFSISLSPAFGARGLLEHFVVKEGQETYSYYGPYNKISFNVGYHHEHHDLIGVSWKNLPKIRQIAPEFYQDLYAHNSYYGLIWNFISNPECSLYRRIARKSDAASSTFAESENRTPVSATPNF